MADNITFVIERYTDVLFDEACDYIAYLYDEDEIPSDRMEEVAQAVIDKMAEPDDEFGTAFKRWFYNKRPKLFDMMAQCIRDAEDEYIFEHIELAAKEFVTKEEA